MVTGIAYSLKWPSAMGILLTALDASNITLLKLAAGHRSSIIWCIKEVILHRAWLVLGWVYHLST